MFEHHPYLRGKLVLLLAVGISHDEAANWAETHPPIIDAFAAEPEIAADLAKYRILARMYPFLRVYLTSGHSWRAAVWLDSYLRGREGKATLDETLARLARYFEKCRNMLYEDETRQASFDYRFPLGDRDFKVEK